MIFKITDQQRKDLLAYMMKRPYFEVAQLIALLVSIKPEQQEKKNDGKNKKDLS